VGVPIHLHPTAELAPRVLLPGDPGRALRLAQALLERPKMFNHNRGLWGYTGPAADGELLTIQSTGMGGPSAAIVVTELAELGARRFLRVGTCGALDRSLNLGDILIASEAIAADGTSRALGAQGRSLPDPSLLSALATAGDGGVGSGVVVSSDLFYEAAEDQERDWIAAGALAVEMETATLYALADRRRLQAASLLLVSGLVGTARRIDAGREAEGLVGTARRIDDASLHAAEERMGELAVRALALAGS
jgi:DeoD family purine-nucleoside phosphorylase